LYVYIYIYIYVYMYITVDGIYSYGMHDDTVNCLRMC